nr:hypothetical protein [Kocuria turfanensis]
MSAGIELALVLHVSHVIRVLQQAVQLTSRDRALGFPGGLTCGEAKIRHRRFEPVDRVASGGVKFPSFEHERSSFLVEGDAVDHPTFDVDANIQVAEPCLTERAAVDGLIPHLDFDVLTAELVLDLVHDVGDSFHGLGVRALPEILAGGQQPDVELVEMTTCDGSVDEISERA